MVVYLYWLRLDRIHDKQSEAEVWWEYGPLLNVFGWAVWILIRLEWLDWNVVQLRLDQVLHVDFPLGQRPSYWCWACQTCWWVRVIWIGWLDWVSRTSTDRLKQFPSNLLFQTGLGAIFMFGIWVVWSRSVSDLASLTGRIGLQVVVAFWSYGSLQIMLAFKLW